MTKKEEKMSVGDWIVGSIVLVFVIFVIWAAMQFLLIPLGQYLVTPWTSAGTTADQIDEIKNCADNNYYLSGNKDFSISWRVSTTTFEDFKNCLQNY